MGGKKNEKEKKNRKKKEGKKRQETREGGVREVFKKEKDSFENLRQSTQQHNNTRIQQQQ